MNRGVAGSGEGFDRPAVGKVGSRFWNKPSSPELRSSMFRVCAHTVVRPSGFLREIAPLGSHKHAFTHSSCTACRCTGAAELADA